MAVVPLGILGSAVIDDPGGSSDTLDITLTTGIDASDVTTARLIVLRYVTVTPGPLTVASTITDDAVLTPPNVCYGPNDYEHSTGVLIGFGTSPYVKATAQAGFIMQPLPAGKTISITFSDVFDYARGWAFGYEGAGWGPDPQSWGDYFPLPPPVAGCQSVVNTYAAGDTYANLIAIEQRQTGVSSITFLDGAITVVDDFYDWGGSAHVSAAIGEGVVAAGPGEIGACTDQYPTISDLDFQGSMMPVGEHDGFDPCPAAYGISASMGDFVNTQP